MAKVKTTGFWIILIVFLFSFKEYRLNDEILKGKVKFVHLIASYPIDSAGNKLDGQLGPAIGRPFSLSKTYFNKEGYIILHSSTFSKKANGLKRYLHPIMKRI